MPDDEVCGGEPELFLAFDNDDPMFALGVEIGMLYMRLATGEEDVTATVHADNTEMVIRLAEAFNREFVGDTLDDDNMIVRFP